MQVRSWVATALIGCCVLSAGCGDSNEIVQGGGYEMTAAEQSNAEDFSEMRDAETKAEEDAIEEAKKQARRRGAGRP